MSFNFKQSARCCDLGAQLLLVGAMGYFALTLLKCGFRKEYDSMMNVDQMLIKPMVGLVAAVSLTGIGNCLEIAGKIASETSCT